MIRRARVAVGFLVLMAGSCASDTAEPESTTTESTTTESTTTESSVPLEAPIVTDSSGDTVDNGAAGRGQDRRSDSPYENGIIKFTVVDPTRPTDEVRNRNNEVVVEAADTRTIPVRVAYPAESAGEHSKPAGSGFPLLVYAHGVASSGGGVPGYVEHLVAAGYVVAAPDFPETSGAARNPSDYLEQPADVSFVLDHLISRVSDPNDELFGLFDLERMAIAGHSLGGLTTYALAFHDCCRDDRFDVALVYAAAYLFPEGDLELSDLPTLYVTGTIDETPGVELMPEFFEQMQGPAYLLTLIDEEHSAGLYGAPRYRRPTNQATVAFLDAHLNDDATALDAIESVVGLYDWQRND